jgi:hypothetical protein
MGSSSFCFSLVFVVVDEEGHLLQSAPRDCHCPKHLGMLLYIYLGEDIAC